MEFLKDVGMFLYGLVKSGVNFVFFWFLVYVLIHLFGKFIVSGGNKSKYKEFKKYVQEGLMNYSKAFCELSWAHLDSAKLWTEEKILKNKEKRKNRVYHR